MKTEKKMPKYSSKGVRAKMNKAAEKMLFNTKRSK